MICTTRYRKPYRKKTRRRERRRSGGETLSSSGGGSGLTMRPSGEEGGFNKRNTVYRGSISGPVYITESRSGSTTPYQISSQPASGPLTGTLTPMPKGELEIPYLSLRDLDMDMETHKQHRMSTSAMPIEELAGEDALEERRRRRVLILGYPGEEYKRICDSNLQQFKLSPRVTS